MEDAIGWWATVVILICEVVSSVIGGVISTWIGSLVFLIVVFWSTVIISGLFLCLHTFNVETKFPILPKVRLCYILLWGVLYLILSAVSFISFSLYAVRVYVCAFIFIVDLFVWVRAYLKSRRPVVTASNPGAAVSI